MKAIALAGLLAGACVVSARAQEATAGLRYDYLDTKGSRSQVQEYDGKLYRYPYGDVTVGNQGDYGLFDLSVKDIGSTEENASLNVDYKDTLKMSALWDNMHHRLNERGSGLISNNAYLPNPSIVSTLAHDQNFVIRRTESEFNLALFAEENSARWLSLRYWSAEKAGSTAFHAGTYQLGRANIDNLTQDVKVGLGTNLGERAAMSLDLIYNDFKDNALVVAYPAALGGILKPALATQTMHAAEARFKYNPTKQLALTGAFTGRQRNSHTNDFKDNIVVGALNAAYRLSQKLSLTARLYLRANQVDENLSFQALWPGETTNTHQIDKTALRGELAANWRPVPKVAVKGSYKLEFTNRRDAPTEVYATPRYYFDGSFLPEGSWNNSVPNSDTRHTATVGATVELPWGIEAEGTYKRLQANRAAFVGQPTWQNDANATVTVPLPAQVQLSVIGGYINERNKNDAISRHYSAQRNTYRAALDWAANNRTFIGADASYESILYIFDGRFGSGSAASPGTAFYESGMATTQRNTVLGGHGRVNLPKGFVVMTRGSYTWSKVKTPIRYFNAPLNFSIDDYSPSDVRIARGSLGVEYTPGRYKDLTARASYRLDNWVDRTDGSNSGQAGIAEVGASMKF